MVEALVIRPAGPEDEPLLRELLDGLSERTLRLRFHRWVPGEDAKGALAHSFALPADRWHAALVCEAHEGARRRLVGEARYCGNPSGESCEFGILVAERWQRLGVGRALMQALLEEARRHGFKRMQGLVLRDNGPMLHFAERLGFVAEPVAEDPEEMRVVKAL